MPQCGCCKDCRVAPVQLLPPFLPLSPLPAWLQHTAVTRIHLCHHPTVGLMSSPVKPPQAQHVGRPHPRPGGPGPASEGPQPAFESVHETRERLDPRAAGVHDARPRAQSPGSSAGRTCTRGLAWGEPALGSSASSLASWGFSSPSSLGRCLTPLAQGTMPVTPCSSLTSAGSGPGHQVGEQSGGPSIQCNRGPSVGWSLHPREQGRWAGNSPEDRDLEAS